MNTIANAVKAFIADEEGVTAIEYGLIAALIAAALVAGLTVVTGSLSDAFGYIRDQISDATSPPAAG